MAILPAADVATYLEALRPPDERALKAVLLNAAPGDYEAAREHAVTRDRGGARRARPQPRRAARGPARPAAGGAAAVVPELREPPRPPRPAERGRARGPALHRRPGGPPEHVRAHRPVDRARAGGRRRAEFARRYLRHLGPSTHTDLAAWAGIAPSHAKALLQARRGRARRRSARRSCWPTTLAAFESPPKRARRRGCSGAGDPLLNARDRERPDRPTRRCASGSGARSAAPASCCTTAAPAGLWRARKQGRRLTIETEWFGEPVDIAERGGAAGGAARRRLRGVAVHDPERVRLDRRSRASRRCCAALGQQARHGVGGQRARDVEALGEVAAQLLEPAPRLV